jgi:phenylacetic acid degradation operon negative regulatory protein
MLHSLIVADKIGVTPGLAPLTPRSIVLSVLLGTHPPQMPVRRILEFTSLFGISDGTVRTALSRMVASGELHGDGGVYALTGRLLERQVQQDTGRSGPPASWDGTWWLAAVVAERRSVADRRSFRSRVEGARLGELRPDLWLRPANIDVPTDLPGVVLTRGPLYTGDAIEMTRQLWDLDALRRSAAGQVAELDDADRELAGGEHRALATTFVTLAACQRFLRTEPQLPVALWPDATSTTVRHRYAAVVDRFQRQLAGFFAERSGR